MAVKTVKLLEYNHGGKLRYLGATRDTNLTFVGDVCESRRSWEAIRPELKSYLSLHRWVLTLHDAAH